MAVVRARSSPPYGLFISIFLCVVMAALAIVFYVMYSKADVDRATAEAKANQLADSADWQAVRAANLNDPKNPAVRQLQAQLKGLREMIAGANNTSSVDVLKADGDLKAALEKGSLKNAISGLTADNNQLKESLNQANALAKSEGGRATDSLRQVVSLTSSYEQTAAQQNTLLAKLQKDLADANARADQAVAAAQDMQSKLLGKAEDDRRNLVLENEQLKAQAVQLTAALKEVTDRLHNTQHGVETLAGEPDGHIIRMNAPEGEVYIDLASKDHILPGMTFTAYDPRIGVRYGTDELAQGDGSIEVKEVHETYSVCRITHTSKGHVIQTGDLIANVVYHSDKSRKTRFVVIGDWDLDGDGVYTAAERDRLISRITRSGGVVDTQVTSQTDYLVAGVKPLSPTIVQELGADAAATTPATAPAATTEATPAATPGGIADERSKQQLQYDDLVSTARSLSIPVLNANRFLAMIGYYNTTIIRY